MLERWNITCRHTVRARDAALGRHGGQHSAGKKAAQPRSRRSRTQAAELLAKRSYPLPASNEDETNGNRNG